MILVQISNANATSTHFNNRMRFNARRGFHSQRRFNAGKPCVSNTKQLDSTSTPTGASVGKGAPPEKVLKRRVWALRNETLRDTSKHFDASKRELRRFETLVSKRSPVPRCASFPWRCFQSLPGLQCARTHWSRAWGDVYTYIYIYIERERERDR